MGVLRLALALLVVYAHCVYPFGRFGVSGENAVEIFYMISGFYMTLVLGDRYAAPGGAGIKAFYANRALRIFPAYFLVAGITLFLCLFGRALIGWEPQAARHLAEWRAAGLLDVPELLWLGFSQLSMIGLESFNFLTLSNQGDVMLTAGVSADAHELWRLLLVPQAWSLSVELYFYALAPFIVTRGTRFIIGLAMASFALRVALWQLAGLNADPWSYRFFPSELMFFLLGAVACRIYTGRLQGGAARDVVSPYMRIFLAVMAVLAVAIGRLDMDFGPGDVIAPLVTAAAFLALPTLFEKTRSNRLDRVIGELSYPVYIAHVLVIWIVGRGLYDSSGPAFLLTAVLVLMAAAALYRWVDKPVDRWRHARTARLREIRNPDPAGRRGAPATSGRTSAPI
ncbi:MAG: putative acyltransferase [Betaproteobacteria bacterium]|nr:putative acyltransferase [Betaproteobacteria bacterium]